jgi:hypothetical protein
MFFDYPTIKPPIALSEKHRNIKSSKWPSKHPHVVAITVGVTFAPLLSEQSHIRATLGFSENLDASPGGDTPGVVLWDDLGETIRQAFGSGRKITRRAASPASRSMQATPLAMHPRHTLSVTKGGDDIVCIQSILLTSPNGERVGFAGDVLMQSGADRLYSS